jgi:hypothetical protein
LTRQLPNFRPNFRPSKLTAIAVGGAFCLAAAGSVSAVALSSSTHDSSAATAAGLTSETTQVEQRAMVETMAQAASAAAKAAAAKAAAAKAAQEHAAHVAHQQHAQILAARAAAAQKAAAAKAAAAKAAAAKAAAAKAAAAKTAQQATAAVATPSGSPQQIAQELLAQDGMGGQFSCLDSLWQRESGWSVTASNASSGAYGIPQALPGSKMESAGSDWQTNPETQIKWGLQYIDSTYGSPCGAWSHEESSGWY